MSIHSIIPTNQLIDQMPGLWVLLDFESKFIAANSTALKWTGFIKRDAVIGKSYQDMQCRASEQHQNFIDQDQIFIKQGSGKIIGLYCYHNDDWKIVLAEKYVLRDDSKNPIGLVSYLSDITHTGTINVSNFLKVTSKNNKIHAEQGGYILDGSFIEISLTTRQLECLFFLIRGKSAKDISHLLFISYRTVEKHLSELKTKFNCKTKSELIEKAIEMNFMQAIPKSLCTLFIN